MANTGYWWSDLDGMAFTTTDRDNDMGSGNCASRQRAGWWHSACNDAQLTGVYANEGIRWRPSHPQLTFGDMKIQIP